LRQAVVDQGSLTCGYAGDVVAAVTLPDIPTPTTRALSNDYYPTPRHVVAAVRRTLGLPFEADPFADIRPGDKTYDVPDTSFTGPF